MVDASETHILAVDGGGTRCRIALRGTGAPLIAELGSVNVSTDFPAASAELLRGLREVAGQSDLSLEDLAEIPAYIGLAGVTGAEIVDRLSAALPFRHARIEDDRPSALRGALGGRDGIVMHCGTGSFAAAQDRGRVRFVGGWGPVLGDEASAQWVGRRALARALDAADGLLGETGLSRGVLERFGGSAGVVAFAGRASPAEFGALAVEVTRSAAEGDAIGLLILQEAGDFVAATCRKLGWVRGVPVCLTGGIGPYFKEFLPAEMRGDLVPALGEPLAGAISLAEDFRQEIASGHR